MLVILLFSPNSWKLGVFSNSKGFGAGRGSLPLDSPRFPTGFWIGFQHRVPISYFGTDCRFKNYVKVRRVEWLKHGVQPAFWEGTDADPYDPRRGFLYRYIGWFLMHKTPKMIEAKPGGIAESVFGLTVNLKLITNPKRPQQKRKTSSKY